MKSFEVHNLHIIFRSKRYRKHMKVKTNNEYNSGFRNTVQLFGIHGYIYLWKKKMKADKFKLQRAFSISVEIVDIETFGYSTQSVCEFLLHFNSEICHNQLYIISCIRTWLKFFLYTYPIAEKEPWEQT